MVFTMTLLCQEVEEMKKKSTQNTLPEKNISTEASVDPIDEDLRINDPPMQFPKIDAINKVVRRIEQVIMITSISMLAIVLFAQVILRYFFQSGFSWAEEVGTCFNFFLSYIGASYAARQSKHIKMTMISERMSLKGRKKMAFFTDTIAFGGFALITAFCARFGWGVYQSGRIWESLHIGKWVLWLPIVVGLGATALQFLVILIKNTKDKNHLWTGSERRLEDPPLTLY